MKHLRTADILLRVIAALSVLSAAPLLLFFSIFITDSGTADAQRMFWRVVAGILLGTCVLLAWLVWPQKIERFVPGPLWIGILVVRGPLYLLGLSGGAALLWLQFRSVV